MTTPTPQRLLWIVNHETLMGAEVPILRSLGYEVFIPKLVPDDPQYRSSAVSYEYDAGLRLAPATLAVLNRHRFYERPWPPTVASIVNDHFEILVTTVSHYTMPLSEAARKFHGHGRCARLWPGAPEHLLRSSRAHAPPRPPRRDKRDR